MSAEAVTITGHGGDQIEAYLAYPLDGGPRGGVVVIHHMPGYDSATKEIVRRFAAEGYLALCPNLYSREAPGADPDDAAATVRAAGGVPDERLVGDVAGAVEYLKKLDSANGKIGVIGYCSGGRHAFLAACSLQVDAAVDCYGAFVVNDPPPGRPKHMQAILHLAPRLSCPLLGLFGADDQHPSPAETAALAAELDRLGKQYEFHTYDGAGHAFFAVDRPSYRPEAAVDGWRRILDFFGTHLTS
ncbi:MAG TPA: dienelactone hydrolase family protein [Pseudonocardiaceae bacterium]|nr:dienelactone hydrolase family protein [Pseudonocardiaceae bacterium]